jgi:SAM-dependent methyltransferase
MAISLDLRVQSNYSSERFAELERIAQLRNTFHPHIRRDNYHNLSSPMNLYHAITGFQKLGCGKNSIVLDLGCGTGFVLSAFAELGCKVFGVEDEDNLIALANNHFSKKGFLHKPIILKADYDSDDFLSGIFNDFSFRDVDFIYWFSHRESRYINSTVHRLSEHLKSGAAVYVTQFWSENNPAFKNGYEYNPDVGPRFLIKK